MIVKFNKILIKEKLLAQIPQTKLRIEQLEKIILPYKEQQKTNTDKWNSYSEWQKWWLNFAGNVNPDEKYRYGCIGANHILWVNNIASIQSVIENNQQYLVKIDRFIEFIDECSSNYVELDTEKDSWILL